MITLQGCEDVQVDETGGGIPPAGVIRGTVTYNGPPPCSQAGHIVGNAVILVFDARNPPPPAGLGVTAANFGVVSGDTLFNNWPRTQGAAKVCPDANAPNYFATATYAISPMNAGQYVAQGFFDYTGDFFATFKFRQLPEATDVGGGYLDIAAAQAVYTDPDVITLPDGGQYYLEQAAQSDPNYSPNFLPIPIGTPGAPSPNSLRGIPSFTMPEEGYLADNIPIILTARLPLARPYFFPEGVSSTALPFAQPLSTITVNAPSSDRPAAPGTKTPQNPSGNVDFVPVLSFPQDIGIYAQPNSGNLAAHPAVAQQVVNSYQSAFPQIRLNAGVPLVEQRVASDTADAGDPFHMQLGAPNLPGEAPGGNGGIYVWWNTCDGLPGCDSNEDDFIPEAPGVVYRMWPLVVLAKLDDLPSGNQPTPGDPESLNAQGADGTKPIVIIQGITLLGDTFLGTTTQGGAFGVPTPTATPDLTANTNLQDHVTVMLRPSTLCLDPRAPDQGGVLVAPGTLTGGNIVGPYPPADTFDPPTPGASGTVVAGSQLTNSQLTTLVNHNAAGTSNGLMGGCLPMGRYQVNLVYPTGQAWTTPNETGSCAAAEGNTLFTGAFTAATAKAGVTDPLFNGCSAVSPRPVLYSQGTRAVVEITAAQNPKNCQPDSAQNGFIPATPFVCTSLCSDPSLDATANPPCSKPLVPAPKVAVDAGP